jgi:transcriptional regulator with XRE-family HTH domain
MAARMETDDVNLRIARRVRDLRSQRGFTLDALAARCGVSRSMISTIERAASSPTAAVLEKIAAGLDVSLASMFAADDNAAVVEPLVRRAQQSEWRDPESGYTRRTLTPPNWSSPLQMTEVVFPPGARVTYDAGTRQTTVHQQIWVVQGQIDVLVGEQPYALREGDCLAMTLGQPLIFSNRTRSPARYVVAVSLSTFAG